MPFDVSIIVPTYKEAENLPILIPRIHEALRRANLDGQIIIVDDNSPDDTPAICERLAGEHPVRLAIRRDERGLSSAVVHGLNLASGRILLVMDADLSHPPERIPDLVAAFDDPAVDFAIGSRYVPGGSTDSEWGLFRYLNSKVATIMARPFTNARDPMAGFFALRRESFERADALDPVGYKIGLELIVKCNCQGIREVPIHFSDRLHGQTKLTLREQVNYIRHLKRLFEYKVGGWARLAQFCIVGASGAVIDLIVYGVLMQFMGLGLARALAIATAMTWNFNLNRRFTFSYARGGAILQQYLLFVAACSVGAVVNWSTSLGLRHVSPFFIDHPLIAAALGIIAGTMWNYLLSNYIVFRRIRRAGAQPRPWENAPASPRWARARTR
jgi:dolichol-phosphate mannosyltransferase